MNSPSLNAVALKGLIAVLINAMFNSPFIEFLFKAATCALKQDYVI